MPDSSIVRFRHVVGVALAHLEARREEINDLNVFPVADGDTGDNMALTMRHVLDELDQLERSGDGDPRRPEIVREVARAALMGARGNSGVILSQIVRGAAEKVATPPGRLIDPELIEAALTNAADRAYASVREPAEGTMLTVIRAMADAVAERRAQWLRERLDADAGEAEQNALLAEMLATALFAGEEALRHTTEQLDVLAEAGVVDAGALGLVVIIRGMIAGLAGEQVQLPEIPHYAAARLDQVHHADSAVPLLHQLHRHRRRPRRRRRSSPGSRRSATRCSSSATRRRSRSTCTPTTPTPRRRCSPAPARSATSTSPTCTSRSPTSARGSAAGARPWSRSPAATGCGALFESLGAMVVDGGPTLNPSTKDLLGGDRGLRRRRGGRAAELGQRADGRRGGRATGGQVGPRGRRRGLRLAAGRARGAGRVRPRRRRRRERERLDAGLAAIRVGAVAPAARDDADGRFRRGDSVGFVDGEIVAWGGAGSTLIETVAALADGAEIVTVIEGAEAPLALAELELELGRRDRARAPARRHRRTTPG